MCTCVRADGSGGGQSVNGIFAANSWTSLFKHGQAIATDPRLTPRWEEPRWTFMSSRARKNDRIF